MLTHIKYWLFHSTQFISWTHIIVTIFIYGQGVTEMLIANQIFLFAFEQMYCSFYLRLMLEW